MLYQLLDLPADCGRVVQLFDDMRLRLRLLLQQQPTRWAGLLRRSQFARAIQGSNSIEGYHVTVDDAVAAVEGEQPLIDERSEPWLAVRAHREAMTFVLQLADDAHFSHHEAMLRSLHYDVELRPRQTSGAVASRRHLRASRDEQRDRVRGA